jgi:cold shock CspA family protein/ribosome-associated translation inhibitor RaiA
VPKSIKPSGRRRGHQVAKQRPRRQSGAPAVQVVDDGAELSPAQLALIRRECAKLSQFYERILELRVVVTVTNRRLHREVILYQVRMHVSVPRGELVIRRQQHTDLLTAVQNATAAARRRIQDYARRDRPPLGSPARSDLGRVVRLFPYEGYGFIESPEGEIYFHRHSVLDDSFDRLAVGDRVRYSTEEGERGTQASTVAKTATTRSRRPAVG